MRAQWARVSRSLTAAAVALTCLASTPATAGPIAFGDWMEFSFTEEGVGAVGCFPADPAAGFCIPSSGTPTFFADAPPWTFDAPIGGATLTVTDAFFSGDQFEILDNGMVLGFTSPPVADVDCGDDPVVCLGMAGMSNRVFLLGAGAHSITIAPLLAPDGGGSAYFLVESAIPEPATLVLLATGLGLSAIRRRGRGRG